MVVMCWLELKYLYFSKEKVKERSIFLEIFMLRMQEVNTLNQVLK